MIKNNLEEKQRKQLIWVLSGAAFLIFFQAFMIAPLIPKFAYIFEVPVETIGLMVPAYLIPYGVATLIYGPLSDRFGRKIVIFTSLVCFIILTGLTASATSVTSMLWFRLLTGVGASGVVPIVLALIGDMFPFNERGPALGWIFAAMAGGMAFGSTSGAILEPFITWQGLFLSVSILSSMVLLSLLPYKSLLDVRAPESHPISLRKLISSYKELLNSKRGLRTYAYVLLNSILHSGIYTWLGLYFTQRYGLSEVGIGLAILGYGVPGLLFGPTIAKLADRLGRNHLITVGLAMTGLSSLIFAIKSPILVAVILVTTVSLGYDLTQPLFAGIITNLSPKRGIAMGLNVFLLFTGFGFGSLIFSFFFRWGLSTAYIAFGIIAILATILAIPLFSTEKPLKRNQ